MASSEAAPFTKVGGLGEVLGALPQALAALGHTLCVYLPGRDPSLGEPLRRIRIHSRGRVQELPLRSLRRQGVELRFVGGQAFEGKPVYGEGELERYALFCLAIAADLRERVPDILHLHDWPTALLAVLVKQQGLPVRTVFTIHNLAYQGCFSADMFFELTGLSWELFRVEALEFYGQVNLLKGALVFADALTTVSPSYAKEIQTSAYGEGLEGVLQEQAPKLTGLLNGLDTELWNPADDPFLAAPYRQVQAPEGPEGPGEPGKGACQAWLRERCGIQRPLLGVVSRLVYQKGIDLILEAWDRLEAMGFGLVALGSGEASLEDRLASLAGKRPGRVFYHRGYNDALAHQIYAGASLFLMPSRWEPCGLSQMIAQRYGTPPVVRRSGGLRDSVVHGQTGLVFEEASADALCEGVACVVGREQELQAMANAGMVLDRSWGASASALETLYKSLLTSS